MTSLCFCKAEAGHFVSIGPSIISFTACALCLPVAMRIIFFDLRIVEMPIVSALLIFVLFALWVDCVRLTILVLLSNGEPGSLNAM